MGIFSRKLFPACETMCVCCPALRSASKQPVKRYKKLLAEIFPKSSDGCSNDRKIAKLCEYALKNPFRIPKIAKYLEERCHKELRSEHIKYVNVIGDTYNKLLCTCKGQMAYFAINLLNVVVELLDESRPDSCRITGCQTLTTFIYSQVDGTYTHNIESFVPKVCKLSRGAGDENQNRCLRASSLQCLSAMVWFMGEFSHIFSDFDEMVHVILDNYELDGRNGEGTVSREAHHNWVDEVLRHEGKGVGELSPIMRRRPDKKDPSLLTREEVETPKVWAQICIQRMVDLAKESTTLRRVLEPMFIYFDTGRHWIPRHGLAIIVLSDMSYFLDSSETQQLILAGVIRHLDHKNIAHDPQVKSHVIQTASALTRQIRAGAALSDIGFVSDLCRHLRKSLQATFESVGEQGLSLNLALQASIEDCLLEIAKGIVDVRPLFDMMAMTLEKLPCARVAASATMGSLIILAHMVSLASASSHIQQAFPEALLDQLLKVMLHPDVEIRVGGHHIFSVLLIPSTKYLRKLHSNGTSTFASVSALLQRLRKEHGLNAQDDSDVRNNVDEEWKEGWACRSSPNFHKLSSIVDRATGTVNLAETEPSILKLNEDQIVQALSAFWAQAIVPDNMPANIEAIARSFCLTLISARLTNHKGSLIVRFFQFPLSLMKMSLDSNYGSLPPSYQRSLLMLSTAILMFMGRIYHIAELNTLLKPLVECDVDPYLGISDVFQVHVKPHMDLKEYGSASDNQAAASVLSELKSKVKELHTTILDVLVQSLCSITELVADDLVQQLSEGFTPEDTFFFNQQSIIDMDDDQMVAHSKESSPFDEDFPGNSIGDEYTISESSVADICRFMPNMPASPSPSMSHIVTVGQLLESALEVAGQVAGTSVSNSPLPYSTMAGQCEALGTDMRKKLSCWLNDGHSSESSSFVLPPVRQDALSVMRKINSEDGAVLPKEPWLSLRLPPASPFDNFLRAARG